MPLSNASFTRWANGKPAGWELRRGNANTVRFAAPSGANDAAALEFRPPYNYVQVAQTVSGMGSLSGKLVRVTARVLSGDSKSAVVRIEQADFDSMFSQYHPGDGAWHELKVSYRVPAYSMTDTLTIVVGSARNPKHSTYVDWIDLSIE